MLLKIIVSIFLLQAPAAVKKEQQKPTDSKQKNTATLPSDTRQSAPPVKNNVTTKNEENGTKEEPKGWPAASDILYPTWALVIVTGLAVYFALKTLRAIRDQVTSGGGRR